MCNKITAYKVLKEEIKLSLLPDDTVAVYRKFQKLKNKAFLELSNELNKVTR